MSSKRKTIIIGITGSFGTGKTTVAKMFKRLGAIALDADKMAHETYKKDTASYKKIIKAFGNRILDRSGEIDRAKVANLVFQNKRSLVKLCDIIHPVVVNKIKESIKRISKSKRASLIVIDAPLLIEAGLRNIVDYLMVVKTSQFTQIKRATRKTGLSANDILRRIKNQMPLNKKVRMADYVIDNEGSKSETKKIVKKIWEELSETRTCGTK